MRTNRGLLAIIIVALVAMLAACGGGGAITPPADGNPGGDTGNTGVAPLASDDLSEWADQTEFNDAPKVARGIPPVPRDTSKIPRSVSDVENQFVLGKDALDFSQ